MGDEERDIVEDEAKPAEPAGSSATSKIVKILLYVAGAIIVVVLMIGISYLVARNVQESMYDKSQDIIAQPSPDPLATYELPPFSSTTSDEEPHFLKLTLSLGYVPSPELNNELIRRKDEMQHIINILLQGKKFEDLDSVSDSLILSEEIKARINQRLNAGKIKEVYFKEIVRN
ncbi:MAG TPA: flagellar basal body-associated FliL family protein [Spirochaetota bacterium]|nr:flagellar basal body-associated FliL family protein [Spirochaetota bacterium]